MEIKVKQAVGSNSRTTSTLSLTEGLKLPEAVKNRIKNDAGEFLVERILSAAAHQESPVEGEDWPSLSPLYKKKKLAEGLGGKANLEFEGDLLDALTFKETKDGIELGWFGKQAGKADGHANLSGESQIPTRRLIPAEGQEFVPSIQQELERIVADAVTDELDFKSDDFEGVETKTALYETLSDYFPDASRPEIRELITRTPKLASLLEDLDLLDLL